MRRLFLLLASSVVLCAPDEGVCAEGKPAGFRVVVHPDNPIDSVDRKVLADAFLKKVSRWPDNELIRPVDRADSEVRDRFSLEVVGRSVAAVRSYWQQLIFSGRGVPPPELDGDEAVLKYVLKHRGAVGYVSAGADVGRAKVVAVK
jgi:ABC-type phosphate transport system substrate-binding protein